MGKTFTPKYRVVIWEYTGRTQKHVEGWDCKSYGRPTIKNLAKFIADLQKSYELGEVNEHISKMYGCIPNVFKAMIETNERNYPETMAQYYAPLFQTF
jgi:hypothetical protein